MALIHLVRHGDNNLVGKRLAGKLPGIELNLRGRTQAEALGAQFENDEIKAVYASPLERTMQTAEPIASRHALKVIPRPGLIELDIGSWQGKSLKSLRKRKLWNAVQYTPSMIRFPGGESYVEAQGRIVSELETLRNLHEDPKDIIVCVTHADIIKLAIAHYLGLHLDLFQRLAIATASISTLAFHDGIPRLVRLNDTRATKADECE
ncbi:MAG: histidine phosphatase family protein [Anaerolineales bacterium]|jgi:probable phosphoglycerate mutase